MKTVNMLDAKTQLSKLVEEVESGSEPEIVIARNGKPAVKLVRLSGTSAGKRIGLLSGKYPDLILEDFNSTDEEVGLLLAGSK